VPTVDGLQFAYALHELPPGGWGFRRWRWELWHGAHLVAAGWRMTRPHAERALRAHAREFGLRLFGLRAAAPVAGEDDARIPPGATVRLDLGPTTAVLVPRALVEERAG
jgi:hypothetical protein